MLEKDEVFLLGRHIFRGYVSFWEGSYKSNLQNKQQTKMTSIFEGQHPPKPSFKTRVMAEFQV